MADFPTLLFCLLTAYACGCVNPAYYGVRLFTGKDLRRHGSGTLGARNVFRLCGLRLAVPVCLFDLFKIWPALCLSDALKAASDSNLTLIVLAGLAGHIFPVQLGFKGGKGAALFAGCALYMLIYNPANVLFYLNIVPVVLAHVRKRDRYSVKIADMDEEFEQIFKLNYATFVEEIPQHEANKAKKLKDKFHADNSYLICKDGDVIAGMVSCCAGRPFSLDAKVENLDAYLPPHTKMCEIRLLAVQKKYRRTRVPSLLFAALAKYTRDNKFDLALISGTTRQLRMYKKLGFTPFYHPVGKDDALYQPMYITDKNLSNARWLN